MGNLFDPLTKYRIFLGSRSPRRKELLEKLGLPFEIWLKEMHDEVHDLDDQPFEVARYLACSKASPYLPEIAHDMILITADTVVIQDGTILGKPADAIEAFRTLSSLSGNHHEVITGVCITTANRQMCFDSRTEVWFDNLTDREIQHYVKTYSPYDKAGAYGIQEWIGYIGITRINGSYFNVMGLPVQRLYQELKGFTNF